MQGTSIQLERLDDALAVAMFDGVFITRASRVPSAPAVRRLVSLVRDQNHRPWALVHVFEIEKVGLPDEPTRAAYGELMAAGGGIFRAVAHVAERAMIQSIVRAVSSGLRLIHRPPQPIQTFASVAEAVPWLETHRPAGAAALTIETASQALEDLRRLPI